MGRARREFRSERSLGSLDCLAIRFVDTRAPRGFRSTGRRCPPAPRQRARAIGVAIADGSLVTAPRRSSHWDAPMHVPPALQIYTVEAPDLGRYDALLVRASA